MYVIGLCGRSGSGKSTVAAFLRRRGVCHIDADKVCRDVYDTNRECIDELCSRFGADILIAEKINRALLAERAFGSENGIKDLNRIAHRHISEEIMRQLCDFRKAGKRYVLLDAPLLLEAGLDGICDAVVAVVSNDDVQIARLGRRDGKSDAELRKRLEAQTENSMLVKRSDVVIANNGSLDELRLNTLRAMLSIQLKLGLFKRRINQRYVYKDM